MMRLTGLLLAVAGVSATLESCLESNLSPASTLVLPSSPSYQDATGSFNLAVTSLAAAVVFTGSALDASAAVKCARDASVKVTSRCGRHSYAAFGSGGQNGSLVLDVSPLTSFSYDPDTELVTIGSGFRLGALALRLSELGRALPHGTCPFVGVGGHANCGGFGMASRLWGLVIDQVVSVRAVVANGDVLDISADEHSDLFWVRRLCPLLCALLTLAGRPSAARLRPSPP